MSVTAPLDFIVPNPLVSRGKPVFGSPGAELGWRAIQIGVGPRHVLVVWTAPGGDHDDVERAPSAYHIESSADSTNGADGTWRREVSVTDNAARSRAHRFWFDGQSWVRFVATAAADPERGVSIERLDVHDASDGTDDTWLFLGDSITASAFAPGVPSFAESVNAEYPGYFPAQINGGRGGELTTGALARLVGALELYPDVRHVAVAYGTNDAWDGQLAVPQFHANLQTIIERLKAAGRVPILARIPFASDHHHATLPDYNRVIDGLTRESALLPGPDLYAWFRAHPEQLTDGAHPGPEGRAAIQRLWARAMDPLYAPQ